MNIGWTSTNNEDAIMQVKTDTRIVPMILAALLALSFGAAIAAPTAGDAAPDFVLSDQYGEQHALADFKEQWLLVFFYPKADTPGCTTEACNFRDNIYAIRAAGAEVVGISVDSVADQKQFSDKYKLPFTLLSDNDGKVCDAYGVLRNYGAMEVASRQSFLIAPDGSIAKHYATVSPDTHTQNVIADLQRLTASENTDG